MSIQWLFDVIEDRKNNPSEKSYTASLFKDGLPKIAQKVGEEGTEVVVAALAQEDQRLIEEVADLTFHTLVLLSALGLGPALAPLLRADEPRAPEAPAPSAEQVLGWVNDLGSERPIFGIAICAVGSSLSPASRTRKRKKRRKLDS